MKDTFGKIEFSPELELFETIKSLDEFEVAIILYKSYLDDGESHEEAMRLAVDDVVPEGWSSFSVNQSPELRSN